MIAFDLKCSAGHVFEAWFRSSADYQDQSQRKFLECPCCGDRTITKAIMAPNIGVKTNRKTPLKGHKLPDIKNIDDNIKLNESRDNDALKTDQPALKISPQIPLDQKALLDQKAGVSANPASSPASPPASPSKGEALQFFRALRDYVVATHDDVGDKFTETVRKIHYGEEKQRSIYGQASAEDVNDMIEEGIELLPLPLLKKNVQ